MVDQELARLHGRGFANALGFGKSPAILVIDFIKSFTDPASPLGSDCSEQIAQTNRLIAAARPIGVPVLFSTIRYEEPDCADAGIWISKIAGLSTLHADTQGSRLDERLNVTPTDPIIVKKFASAFFGTNLVSRLAHLGVDTLIMTGCTTSGCVRATAVDACQYSFRPIIAAEAVADRSAAAHEQSLTDITLKYGDVLSVDAIVRTLSEILLIAEN